MVPVTFPVWDGGDVGGGGGPDSGSGGSNPEDPQPATSMASDSATPGLMSDFIATPPRIARAGRANPVSSRWAPRAQSCDERAKIRDEAALSGVDGGRESHLAEQESVRLAHRQQFGPMLEPQFDASAKVALNAGNR